MVATFSVYGYRFYIDSAVEAAVQGVIEDFAFFRVDGEPAGTRIELVQADPPYERAPALEATVYTPRNVAYKDGERRYIDYHGRALGIWDRGTRTMVLYSQDDNLLYEATYLFLLSQIGEFLDREKLHRIHALGVCVNGKAVLALLPMGGGKSTLGLSLLQHSEVEILSDDSPFIDSQGQLLAYPLRLGLLPGSEQAIPAENRRVIQRMEFGPKHLVNYSFFKDRVRAKAEPALVLIGSRTLGEDCRIEPVGLIAGMRACAANCIVGMGLFQGLEFILSASGWELMRKVGLGMSRSWNCYQMLRRSRICRVHLGRDRELNARTILAYAQALTTGRG